MLMKFAILSNPPPVMISASKIVQLCIGIVFIAGEVLQKGGESCNPCTIMYEGLGDVQGRGELQRDGMMA